ncbi:MAG: signal peptide peptidase SppA [Planctomycetota bacterium]|nr:signal peptide peptidase SppA [Planctomycetota bacterium]
MIRTLQLALVTGLVVVPLFAQGAATKTAAQGKSALKEASKKSAAAIDPAIGYLHLKGQFADLPEAGADLTSLLMGGGGGKPKGFYDLIDQFEELVYDQTTKQVLFDLSGAVGMNNAQMAEVDRALRKVRKSGKYLVAYLENAGSGQMQIASMCDRVLLADMGGVEIPSASMSVMFMKDALDLLGVKMDVVRCGDFKGAVEPYLLSSMSKHLRKHYEDMLEKMNAAVVNRIATGRKMASAKVRGMQAQRLFTAQEAKAAGLVDDLVPWVGAKRALKKVMGKQDMRFRDVMHQKSKKKSVNFLTMMTNLLNPKTEETKIEKGLVVLHLSGQIVDGTSRVAGSIVSGPVVKQVRELVKDKDVQGVVVRINSPGGSATASEAILLALKELAEAKPVVFSMGSVAASGGYYVTCIGRPIFAEAGTVTGSIGVFGMKPSLGALMRRVGVREEIIGLDSGAGFMSMENIWTDDQRAVMQNNVNQVYDRFTAHVSASRKIPVADVLKIAGGRVWSGEQAIANKLVDKVGGLDAALAMVAKEAGIDDEFEITHLPSPADMFSSLVGDMMGVKALLPGTALQLVARRAGAFEPALRILLDALEGDRPTRVWAMMPEGMVFR